MNMRAIAICCLLAIVLPALILLGGHFILRKQLRHQLKSRIIAHSDASQFATFHFSKAQAEQLDWEHEKEFKLNGFFYDVIQKEQSADSVMLICWIDHEESELVKELKQQLAALSGHHPPLQRNQLLQLQFYKSLFHDKALWVINNFNQAHPFRFKMLIGRCLGPVLAPSSPPPQLMISF